MKPIDYLRAMTKRRRPATGGIVRLKDTPPFETGCTYTMPLAEPVTAPTFLVEINLATPTRAAFDQIRQQIQITARPQRTRSADKNCGCWPRYSHCNCKP